MGKLLRRRGLIAGAAGLLVAARKPAAAAEIGIAGGGSSFINPVMQNWTRMASAPLGLTATYAVLGAGTAQSKVLAGDLDFAAMELPLAADTLESGHLTQFPVAFGALAVVVNIPEIASSKVQLDGVLLAEIYAGSIKKWNDPKIVALNEGVRLPELDIKPVHLAIPGGSVFSTTHAMTQYLLATNPAWREKFGTTVKGRWAVGAMTSNAENLVEVLKSVPGSIGYAALGTVVKSGLATALLRNRAGQAMKADSASLQAAVAQVDWAKSPGLVTNTIDLPGAGSWPLVLTTYALIKQDLADKARAETVRKFFRFALAEGAEGALQSSATSLPSGLRTMVQSLMG